MSQRWPAGFCARGVFYRILVRSILRHRGLLLCLLALSVCAPLMAQEKAVERASLQLLEPDAHGRHTQALGDLVHLHDSDTTQQSKIGALIVELFTSDAQSNPIRIRLHHGDLRQRHLAYRLLHIGMQGMRSEHEADPFTRTLVDLFVNHEERLLTDFGAGDNVQRIELLRIALEVASHPLVGNPVAGVQFMSRLVQRYKQIIGSLIFNAHRPQDRAVALAAYLHVRWTVPASEAVDFSAWTPADPTKVELQTSLQLWLRALLRSRQSDAQFIVLRMVNQLLHESLDLRNGSATPGVQANLSDFFYGVIYTVAYNPDMLFDLVWSLEHDDSPLIDLLGASEADVQLEALLMLNRFVATWVSKEEKKLISGPNLDRLNHTVARLFPHRDDTNGPLTPALGSPIAAVREMARTLLATVVNAKRSDLRPLANRLVDRATPVERKISAEVLDGQPPFEAVALWSALAQQAFFALGALPSVRKPVIVQLADLYGEPLDFRRVPMDREALFAPVFVSRRFADETVDVRWDRVMEAVPLNYASAPHPSFRESLRLIVTMRNLLIALAPSRLDQLQSEELVGLSDQDVRALRSTLWCNLMALGTKKVGGRLWELLEPVERAYALPFREGIGRDVAYFGLGSQEPLVRREARRLLEERGYHELVGQYGDAYTGKRFPLIANPHRLATRADLIQYVESTGTSWNALRTGLRVTPMGLSIKPIR